MRIRLGLSFFSAHLLATARLKLSVNSDILVNPVIYKPAVNYTCVQQKRHLHDRVRRVSVNSSALYFLTAYRKS